VVPVVVRVTLAAVVPGAGQMAAAVDEEESLVVVSYTQQV